MILNATAQKPVLTFGLGRTALEITLGQSVIIYQMKMYDPARYSLLAFSGRRNITQFTITPNARGTFQIRGHLLLDDKSANIFSNTITLTVV